jgi:hypothetical protein
MNKIAEYLSRFQNPVSFGAGVKRLYLLLFLSLAALAPLFSLDFGINGALNTGVRSTVPYNSQQYDFETFLQNNLNISFASGDNQKMIFQLISAGSLFGNGDAQISTALNQLYFQSPLFDFSAIYIGKKIVNIGASRHFSVFNRLDPVSAKTMGSSETGSGIIEYDLFLSNLINFQSVMYYNAVDALADSHNKINPEDFGFLIKYDLSLYPLDFSLLLFFEQVKYLPVGTALSYQIGNTILYVDYFFKPYHEKVQLYGPYSVSFFDNSLFVGGIKYLNTPWALSFEYFYNGDSFSTHEIDEYKNKIENMVMAANDISVNNWTRHNLFFSISVNPLVNLNPNVLIGLSFLANSPSFILVDYMGFAVQPYIEYSFSQSITMNLSARFWAGGSNSLNRLNALEKMRISLGLEFMY